MRFLDSFDVILFDMMGTFMFGHDRFGPEQDYFATYQSLGGRSLSADARQEVMQLSCEALLAIYETPERFEDFPTLRETFQQYGGAKDEDVPLLERVFAAHELGYVPEAHQEFLRQVATTHRLGVVSNLCAHPELWLESYRDIGVFQLFEVLVYSSEGRCIKPSLELFRRAMAAFPSDARKVFVGDSLERDIIPAKSLGMSTVWIAPAGAVHPAADRVIANLPEMALL